MIQHYQPSSDRRLLGSALYDHATALQRTNVPGLTRVAGSVTDDVVMAGRSEARCLRFFCVVLKCDLPKGSLVGLFVLCYPIEVSTLYASI